METRASTRVSTKASDGLAAQRKVKSLVPKVRRVVRKTGPLHTTKTTVQAKPRRLQLPGTGTSRAKMRRAALGAKVPKLDKYYFANVSKELGIPASLKEFVDLQWEDEFCSDMMLYVRGLKLSVDNERARRILLMNCSS